MSPNKLDRRIVRTRKLLCDALIYLMLEVGYDNISIRDLTNRANIGYATFYRHYKTKDELLTYALHATWDEFMRSLDPNLTKMEETLELFRHIERERRTYMAAHTIPRDHPAIKAIHETIASDLAERYQRRDDCNIPFELIVNHLIMSAYEFIRWYLEDGGKYSLEQIAVFYNELIVEATESAMLDARQSGNVTDDVN